MERDSLGGGLYTVRHKVLTCHATPGGHPDRISAPESPMRILLATHHCVTLPHDDVIRLLYGLDMQWQEFVDLTRKGWYEHMQQEHRPPSDLTFSAPYRLINVTLPGILSGLTTTMPIHRHQPRLSPLGHTHSPSNICTNSSPRILGPTLIPIGF